jgi:hypothetical protein
VRVIRAIERFLAATYATREASAGDTERVVREIVTR